MAEDLEKKRQKEMKMMEIIFDIYEKGHPEEKELLSDLRAYARERITRCPKMATKTYCSNCEIHCYKPAFRQKIKEIMRYAGPRLLLRRPVGAIDHMIKGFLHRRNKRK